jgi:hypothetical protein
MPRLFTDPDGVAEDIIRDVGPNLVVGLPLGLGKANHIVNALYARAAADRTISLTLFSALTLEKPKPNSLLERRFIMPVIDRLFVGYPDLAYAYALHAGALPPNVKVIEFFFLAGGGCTCRSRSSITFPPIIPTHHPICWNAGSTSSPSWWRSAWSTASRATA